MFTVYSEKDIFENIVVFNDETPNWYNIFCNHSDVCLNITEKELALEEKQGTPIFEFIMANGGRSPIALKDFFDAIYEDNVVVADKPRSAFFLKYSVEEAARIQSAYGVLVQSENSIDDNILTGSYLRKFFKGEKINDGRNMGWGTLKNFKFPPSNSLVISDNYLLLSSESVGGNMVASGIRNVVWLLHEILPFDLSITYHVTVISEDKNQNEAWRSKIARELNTEINNLRDYEINVEVIFVKHEDLHERLLLMNYINSSCEHGFYLFKARDGETVHVTNKIQISSYFRSLNNSQGDSEYQTACKDLQIIKKVCNDLSTHLKAGGQGFRGAILGGCNANKSLRNRLINDV